jgi:DNA-binding transcriptional regulator YiaG
MRSQVIRAPFTKWKTPYPTDDLMKSLQESMRDSLKDLRKVSDEDIRLAVRELRKRLGLSQVDFARRANKSYAMIQRYEQKRAPVGNAVKPFLDLATSNKFDDLQETLQLGMLRGIVQSEALEDFMTKDALKAVLGAPVHLLQLTEQPLKQWEFYFLQECLFYIRHMHPEKVMTLWKTMDRDTAAWGEVAPQNEDFFEYFKARGVLTAQQLAEWGDAVDDNELKEYKSEPTRPRGRNRLPKKK